MDKEGSVKLKSNMDFDSFKLDANQLIPCIAQHYQTNEVLMMAYMNKESFEKTLETGRMVYFSRSRQKLWMKGEESGHAQYVKELIIDCDKDTILAKVDQVGAACHTGNPTCFYTSLTKNQEVNYMAFVSELLTYLFKFIVLGIIAVAGVMCGAKIKKNKASKEDAE